jgi:hypothetical protein
MKNAFVLILLAAAGLHAGTIVISQGTTPGDFSQPMTGPDGFTGYVDVGWTTGSSSYSNVEIDATLLGADQGLDLVDAYLTTTAGTGTTSPAYATSTGIAVSDSGYSSVALFTGLSLAANTSYYLTIAPESSDQVYWGIDDNQPNPVLDTGVSIIAASFCTDDSGNCADFAPASSGFDSPGSLGANPIFSVTQESASTPEPATSVLLAAGLALAGILRRRSVR